MALEIRKGDLVIKVEGDEATAILQNLGLLGANGELSSHTPLSVINSPSGPSAASPPAGLTDHLARKKQQETIRSIPRLLRSEARSALMELAKTPDGLNDLQLRQRLHLATNMKLAGLLAAISKAASRKKLRPSDLYLRMILEDVEGAKYLYKLTPEALEALENEGTTK